MMGWFIVFMMMVSITITVMLDSRKMLNNLLKVILVITSMLLIIGHAHKQGIVHGVGNSNDWVVKVPTHMIPNDGLVKKYSEICKKSHGVMSVYYDNRGKVILRGWRLRCSPASKYQLTEKGREEVKKLPFGSILLKYF